MLGGIRLVSGISPKTNSDRKPQECFPSALREPPACCVPPEHSPPLGQSNWHIRPLRKTTSLLPLRHLTYHPSTSLPHPHLSTRHPSSTTGTLPPNRSCTRTTPRVPAHSIRPLDSSSLPKSPEVCSLPQLLTIQRGADLDCIPGMWVVLTQMFRPPYTIM